MAVKNVQTNGHNGTEPAYGRRLVFQVVDDRAATEPDRPFVYLPRTQEAKDGWTAWTYRQYAQAINRTAHWLVEKLGKPEPGTFPTISYFGPNDVRYLILCGAVVKAGYQVLLPSPRNNTESQISLFETTNCQYLLHAKEFTGLIAPWLEQYSIKILAVESLEEMTKDEEVAPFPYDKSYQEAALDPCFILHTSGSTGTPKPITWRNALMATSDKYHTDRYWGEYTFCLEAFRQKSEITLCHMPLFHALGLLLFISYGIYWGQPMALGFSSKPPTLDNMMELLKYSPADSSIIPPSVLAEMTTMEEGMELLKKLSFVFTGGGGIPKEAGDRIAQANIPFCNGISSTEYGFYPIYWQNRNENWQYFVFNNDKFNCEYRPVDGGMYEQTVIRQDPQDPGWQGVFYTFPEKSEFTPGDLYRPHPTIPNNWMHCGRSDDVIVFSNGEKFNPVTMEGFISSHHDIRKALVVGAGKFQAGLILEPIDYPTDEEGKQRLIDSVWPLIQTMNAKTIKHGRISKHLVTLSNPEIPFLYSGKGELRKGAVLRLYKDDIDALYDASLAHEKVEILIDSEDSILKSVKRILEDHLGAPQLDEDVDFAAAGIDSLQIINTAKLLSAGLKDAGISEEVADISARVVYQRNTPRKLAAYIFTRLQYGVKHADATKTDAHEIMRSLLDKYTADLPVSIRAKAPANTDSQTVLVTGTTGSLGSYLLHFLEQSPLISKIICVNRSADGGADRQLTANTERGLITDFTKAEFLYADLSQPNLGLDNAKYYEILASVDCIIHNAWPVNFNLTVDSFEPFIRGVRNLVDLAAQADKTASIVFMSSIGTVDAWPETSPIPETRLDAFGYSTLGYGQSKLISSLILDQAMEKSGIPTANIRVGQIAGPRGEKGAWNRQEWLPTIIASSVTIGALPAEMGAMNTVDWLPVEDVANAILDISGCTTSSSGLSTGYFNLTNPSTTEWQALVPVVQDFYEKQGKSLNTVSFQDWIKIIGASDASESANPAVKLLDTYKGALAASQGGHVYSGFSTERTQKASETVREGETVTGDMMIRWCEQWKF